MKMCSFLTEYNIGEFDFNDGQLLEGLEQFSLYVSKDGDHNNSRYCSLHQQERKLSVNLWIYDSLMNQNLIT